MPAGRGVRVDKLGVVITALAAYALLISPFATFRANRIVPGDPVGLLNAVATPVNGLVLALLIAIALLALVKTSVIARLVASVVAIVALCLAIGLAAQHLTPEGNSYARVAPASGFWLLLFAFALMATDALTRLQPPPGVRILALLVTALGIAALLKSGSWDGLSILKEYSTRAASFWREVGTHVTLALGSLAAATVIGLPLGLLCHRIRPLRAAVLNSLNIIQTIPSIALFGLLIAPLGWIATHVPGASAVGIAGIGAAPAFVALFLYSLLPVVANTVTGLAGVPQAAVDAARGVGMTLWQRLTKIELPLAFPVILTGIRIVLVQNIGLATIAALIGGGGLGVFVFQGVGQTAMDLVLLGAVPTVAMAFAAAVLLDAIIDKVRMQA
ncbi:ABC transporter permease [Rhizobium sp. CFBP 8762]|uniref:ABC transporter permease n=1 Tax=Rhizobium sp. CFBP 8762 TaxID=2775279 RepID=UPI00177FCF1E|nr:ABC transporter permease [Rhizobium sp. CFBP 8762]MBD8553722.1 ABC transporter permease [Rhizobium sp. CFBP 8762]